MRLTHSDAEVSSLRLNYFLADADDRLWRIPARSFERLWHDGGDVTRVKSDGEPITLGSEFRLLTVLSDQDWQPLVTFLLRARIRDNRLLIADRYHLYRTLSSGGNREPELDLVRHHLTGWPEDWQSQIAVAMDVPAAAFKQVSIGGPLVMADLWGVGMSTVMRHFEDALSTPSTTR